MAVGRKTAPAFPALPPSRQLLLRCSTSRHPWRSPGGRRKNCSCVFRTSAIPGGRISRLGETCENPRANCASRGREMKAYMCVICGFVYEEAKGVPDQGIAPGTRWKEVPEDRTCPDCGAP